jgi:hypothetical protein
MPRHPRLAARTTWIGASVFEKFKGRLAAAGGRYVKLHIGDREGPLPYPTPFAAAWLAEHPQVPQYVNTSASRRCARPCWTSCARRTRSS